MEEQLLAFLGYLAQEYQYSDNTIAAYRNDLSQFLEYIRRRNGSVPSDWSTVSAEAIGDYLYFMKHKDDPYASSTIARKVAAIKSFFNYLYANGLIKSNPAVDIDSPKVKKRLPQSLTFDEVERLLHAPTGSDSPKNLRDTALLNVLYSTGMRVTEVVTLQLEDFDPEASFLRSPTRQGELREIPVDEATRDILLAYLQNGRPHLVKSDDEHSLFLNHRGEKLTRQGLWLIIKGYARQANLKTEVTPHTLRHSFAVHKLSKGSKLEDLQALLGHAHISTTQIYTQLEPANDKLAENS